MNKDDFHTQYRQARFILHANAIYAIKDKVKEPEGSIVFRAIDTLHKSVKYAVLNRHPSTYYPISENRWAIKQNSTF